MLIDILNVDMECYKQQGKYFSDLSFSEKYTKEGALYLTLL